MSIQMRRGIDADFQPTKLISGELAVLNTSKQVAVAFSDGSVKYLMSTEDAEYYVETAGESADTAVTAAGAAVSAKEAAEHYAETASSAAGYVSENLPGINASATQVANDREAVENYVEDFIKPYYGTFNIITVGNEHRFMARIDEYEECKAGDRYILAAESDLVLPVREYGYHEKLYINGEEWPPHTGLLMSSQLDGMAINAAKCIEISVSQISTFLHARVSTEKVNFRNAISDVYFKANQVDGWLDGMLDEIEGIIGDGGVD